MLLPHPLSPTSSPIPHPIPSHLPRHMLLPCTRLSVRDIQTAFQAGRVRLSETQVIAMGQLVNTFATEYKANHGNIPVAASVEASASALVPSEETKEEPANTTQSRFAPLNVTPLPSAALSPQGHKINAEWLRMYLVNLRLSAAPRGTRR